MLIKNEVRCTGCPKIFCCANCRLLHEAEVHAGLLKDLSTVCFICNGMEFPLSHDTSKEFLEHLVDKHSPLSCNKCNQVYTTVEDFKDIKNCAGVKTVAQEMPPPGKPLTSSKEIPEIEKRIADGELNEEMLTPLTKINLKWRRKSAGLTTSVTTDCSTTFESIKNGQSEHKKPTGTSTPMMPPGSSKGPDSLCGALSFLPSSIERGEDSSLGTILSPPPFNVPQKPVQRRRSIENTPLRQVMSKGLQKAIKENGTNAQRRISFGTVANTTFSQPLDLRTTPVIRRSQTDPSSDKLMNRIEENLDQDFARSETEENIAPEAETMEQNTAYLSVRKDLTPKVTPPNTLAAAIMSPEMWYTPLPLHDDINKNGEPVEETKSSVEQAGLKGMWRKILSFGKSATEMTVVEQPAQKVPTITVESPMSSQKRRRYQTSPVSPIAKKYKMIRGRRPIARMRTE